VPSLPHARCLAGVALVTAVVALAGCPLLEENGVIPSDPPEKFVADKDRACETDDECILVRSSCKGCSCADGSKTAINEDAAGRVAERLEDECAEHVCEEERSTDETCCASAAKCIENQCELTGARGLSFADECEE
jgi:hypothetical protein